MLGNDANFTTVMGNNERHQGFPTVGQETVPAGRAGSGVRHFIAIIAHQKIISAHLHSFDAFDSKKREIGQPVPQSSMIPFQAINVL